MIPELTIDIDAIHENWKDHPEDWDELIKMVEPVALSDKKIPVHLCQDSFIDLGVYKEYKFHNRTMEFYGYCDTENALAEFLKPYIESKDAFYVTVGLLSMDYEKYYKFGSYINKDGVDTKTDYYYYIDEHPDMEVEQDYAERWINFEIYKLLKNEPKSV